jgi:CRP-like cAMP-binding protein
MIDASPESTGPRMPETSSLLNAIADMLMECSMFNDFPPAEFRSVARYFGSSKVDQGQAIFKEGDAGTFMCVINSGDVSVRKSDSEGKKVEIAVLRQGRVFGEMAALDGERRSASCIAATDCVLLTLSKESLDKMLQEAPKTAAKVIRAVAISLSRRLRMADGQLVDHHI